MADDEMRFHLHALTLMHRDHQLRHAKSVTQVRVIDPLLASAWIVGRGFDSTLWAKDHPEVRQSNMPVITAVLANQHWIPVFMSPAHDVLQVSTWDHNTACHDQLNQVVQKLAVGLGFSSALICREHRMFFTSELCGSLALAFLRNALIGSLLATDNHEACAIHDLLRDRYTQILQGCQIVDCPWVWGAGDVEAAPHVQPPPVHITRDQRIDLINERGLAMADDEVRFHIVQLISRQETANTLIGRSFAFFEPLVFNCWSSIGRTITEQWCERHIQVRTRGLNIVTAFAVDNHWIPLWFSPRGNLLQVHTFQNDACDFTQVEEIIGVITDFLDFRTFAIHRIPGGLPSHNLCGAHSMVFLAHVIMHMPLPESVAELRTLHTNMRASFVAHLYSIDSTPLPVAWGNGPRPQQGSSSSGSGSVPQHEVVQRDDLSHAASSTQLPIDRGESGPLPRMPAEEQRLVSPLPPGLVSQRPVLSEGPSTSPVSLDENERQARLLQVTSHSFAMSDDEMLFQLQHLVECQAQPSDRRFLVIPPLSIVQWLDGQDDQLRTWIDQHRPLIGQDDAHVITALLFEQHWIPIWLAPCPKGLIAHTLSDFAADEASVDRILQHLAHKCGSAIHAIHRVPHGIITDRLCGVMTVSFLAHIILGTVVPRSLDDLYSRCWAMKTAFADALRNGPFTCPTVWGWGINWESRQLPIMPEWAPFVAEFQRHQGFTLEGFVQHDVACLPQGAQPGMGMTYVEMSHHLESLSGACRPLWFVSILMVLAPA